MSCLFEGWFFKWKKVRYASKHLLFLMLRDLIDAASCLQFVTVSHINSEILLNVNMSVKQTYKVGNGIGEINLMVEVLFLITDIFAKRHISHQTLWHKLNCSHIIANRSMTCLLTGGYEDRSRTGVSVQLFI